MALGALALHGNPCAALRPARASARAGFAGRLAGDRGCRGPPGVAGRAHVRARVLRALSRLCANAATVGDAVDLLRSRRRARKTEPAERIPPDQRPDLSTLPDDPGVYVFRDERGRPLYVGKSVSLRSRARAHFCAPAGWTERAEIVDYRPTNSSWGRWCSRTGSSRSGSRRATRSSSAPSGIATCAAGSTSPTRSSRWPRARSRARGQRGAAGQPGAGRRARRPAHLAVSATPLRAHAQAARASLGLRPDGPLCLPLSRGPRPERLPAPARSRSGPLRGAGSRRARDRGDRATHARSGARPPLRARQPCCGARSG